MQSTGSTTPTGAQASVAATRRHMGLAASWVLFFSLSLFPVACCSLVLQKYLLNRIVTDSSFVLGYLGGFDGNFLWNRIGAGKISLSSPLLMCTLRSSLITISFVCFLLVMFTLLRKCYTKKNYQCNSPDFLGLANIIYPF